MLSPAQIQARDGRLTADAARQVLNYERDTGVFRWLSGGPGRSAGSIAGYLSADGYWRVKINYRKYSAGRVAWLMVTGEWPTHQIDHINGNRSDNRWINLREATQSQNGANRSVTGSKSTPIKGVYRKGRGWESSIQKDGQYKYLGRFRTIEDARAAYERASRAMFGEFARC
jgi:hypothetical protein